MKIAMWSGPRNISTALMYSFAARGDCAVWDEPFYAACLVATGLDHPMREEVIAAGITDASEVAREIEAREGAPHLYLKLMAQHMLEGFDTGWMQGARHAFLIRHPARVVASFTAKRENPRFEELGFAQLAALYDQVRALGQTPPVIDSDALRRDPEGVLKRVCSALGLDWTEKMLRWPAGGHPSDGVWARHWYGAVHRSTGFAPADPGPLPVLEGRAAELAERALPYYERMAQAAREQAA
ncbi:hypothetical protein SAMN05216257_101202 [Meinhardsimonia xiamenensis]|jgi:hypothetical protein|uniref:Branched-chain amino acid aminotransferase n=1 Tax=Meinhardsimonia xiamenensis TaxID=990712 RepID=A0A1G8Y6B7_9RHOB|nr:sulfotransferase family protein [Meinhardsimonia xiamenensis]PRX37184.1 hypothetical protein LV81_00958 [Meinhardsimonia xiamenensis]SDJ98409.1 hypothetical protein SAMN05216257_101202 [Meinhardsimonia xiamenensis]